MYALSRPPPSYAANSNINPTGTAISFFSRGRRARNSRSPRRRKSISTFKSKFNHFSVSGKRALQDLQSLISVDHDQRVVISCRQSTLHFIGGLVIGFIILVSSYRLFCRMISGFKERFGIGYHLMIRKDRSLGGREVVVGRKKMRHHSLIPPLSAETSLEPEITETRCKDLVSGEFKLPKWWVFPRAAPAFEVNKEDYQRRANILLQATMASRMMGEDIAEDDIVERLMLYHGKEVVRDTKEVPLRDIGN